MRIKSYLPGGIFLLLLIIAFPAVLLAQAVYGSIFGTVTDTNGAAVVGATVTITDLNKGVTYTVTTNDSGNFTQTHLVLGRYRIKVEKEGYKTAVQEPIEVKVDAASRVDMTLQVGQVSEEVTVTAEAPLLKSDRADVAVSFEQKAVTELPIFDRNFTRFELLTPGTVRLAGFQHAASENPQGSIQIQVNGQHFSGTSFQLDGTDNRDPILGIIVINPTLESVTEAKITTQNYDAEFGMANAGVVTAQTKSGTNEFHGSMFAFRRNDVTSARDPFAQSIKNPATGKFIPDTLWGQYGGSLGGPIAKNKSFFFGDYQGQRSKLGGSVLTSVPTARARAGDFSEYGVNIFDPKTGDQTNGTGRTQFPGNVIPPHRLSQQALNLLKFIPLPNITAAGVENNFSASGSEIFNTDQFNVRGDHYFSQKFHYFGRYSFGQYKRNGPAAFGAGGGPQLSQLGGVSDVRNQSLATGFDYTISSNLLTDFRFGFFRYRVAVLPGDFGTTPAKDAGIPGLNNDTTFTSGMPQITIDGKGGFRFGFGLGVNRCNCPLDEQEQQFQVVNNWSRIRGNHTFKFGADLRYAMNLRVPSDAHRSGQLTFNTERTSLVGTGGGLGLATFMLGDVTFFNRFVSSTTDAAERQKRFFFYAQDTWLATPKLTINYGIRWDQIYPESVNKDGAGSFVDLATGEMRVAGIGDINRQGNIQMNYRNFAPRLGISYRIKDKTVIRMGYGKSYDIGVFGSVFGHAVTQNLPVLAIQEIRSPGGRNFLEAFNLAQGPTAPVFPAVPSNGRFRLPNGISVRVRPERMRLPSVDAWNATFQHQLTRTISVEAAYVGNKGTHVFTSDGPSFDLNQPTVVGFGTLSTNERKPFFTKFGWSQSLGYFCNCSSNDYHALQTKVEKRFSDTYSILAHYTLSRQRNFDSNYFTIDPRVNYGVTDNDRTHVFLAANLFELPFGRGKRFLGGASRAVDLIVGGWQINQVTNILSGLPFTPTYQNAGQDRDNGPARPNLVGDANVSNRSAEGWFAVSTKQLTANGETSGPWQRPQKGTFGNVGRNTLRGPKFVNTDFSIFKNFNLTEQWKMSFRAEIFNLFNHANLARPNGCVDCSLGPTGTSGKIRSLQQDALMRQVQFALRLTF